MDPRTVFQVSHTPSLGGTLIGVEQSDTISPRPVVVEDLLLAELRGLRQEVVGLRADLTSRTVAARCRRAWAWIRRIIGADR